MVLNDNANSRDVDGRKRRGKEKANENDGKSNLLEGFFPSLSPSRSPYLFTPMNFAGLEVKCNDRVGIAILVLFLLLLFHSGFSSALFSFLFFFCFRQQVKQTRVCCALLSCFSQSSRQGTSMNFNLKAAGALLSRAKQVFRQESLCWKQIAKISSFPISFWKPKHSVHRRKTRPSYRTNWVRWQFRAFTSLGRSNESMDWTIDIPCWNRTSTESKYPSLICFQ